MSSKSERRQARLQAEREREKELALTTPRHAHDPSWGYWGSGLLVLQLVRRPSHGRSVCYEVRGELGALRLYRSRSRADDDELFMGHERVDVRASELYRLLMAVDAISLPVRVRSENAGVLDGVWYEVAAFGGVEAASRFSWCAGHAPAEWGGLVSLVEPTIERFDCASPSIGDQDAARSGSTGESW